MISSVEKRNRSGFVGSVTNSPFCTQRFCELLELSVTLLKSTPLGDWHKEHGARMTGFAGWSMPLHYSSGILQEHLSVRKFGGLFDISHMGRFRVTGPDAVLFLRSVLTNDAARLELWQAHYTILPREDGSALDDAYLFRFPDGYWLVVNAANAEQDWHHLQEYAQGLSVLLEDMTGTTGMLAVQGPQSEELLKKVLTEGTLPPPVRNTVSQARLEDIDVRISRTGYTGEPVGFELFLPTEDTVRVWERLVEAGESLGIQPVGLGARDTLRLEAGLTLFGHELGLAPNGTPIPIFAAPSASMAVHLTPDRGDFIGRVALEAQAAAYQSYRQGPTQHSESLPRLVRPLAVLGPGIARQGDEVYWNGQRVGWVTSGTVVPYWVFTGQEPDAIPTEETGRRAIALAYINADVPREAAVEINVRGRLLPARVVRRHGRSDLPPYFRPIIVQ